MFFLFCMRVSHVVNLYHCILLCFLDRKGCAANCYPCCYFFTFILFDELLTLRELNHLSCRKRILLQLLSGIFVYAVYVFEYSKYVP